MESVAVSVPGRAVACGAAEKKLRKRKELDAIVAKMNGGRGRESVSDDAVLDAIHTESETSDGGGGFGLRSKLIQQPPTAAAGDRVKAEILLSMCRLPTCRGVATVVAAVATFIAVVLSVSVVVQTKAQVSEIGLQLDKVVRQRNVLEEQYSGLSKQMKDLLANHTEMQDHQVRLEEGLKLVSSQVSTLNETLISVTKSLEEAPHLKTLPADVKLIQTEMAKLGSRIAELESKADSGNNAESRSAGDPKKSELGALQSKVQNLSDAIGTIKEECCRDANAKSSQESPLQS